MNSLYLWETILYDSILFDSYTSQAIRKLITNPKVRNIDAVRLVLLYILRYEKTAGNEAASLRSDLKKRGVNDSLCKVKNLFICDTLLHTQKVLAECSGSGGT